MGHSHAQRWHVGGLSLLVLAVAVLVAAGAGRASAPLTVCPSGCAYTTISDALAHANNGDKILIGPGTYSGGFTISIDVSLVGAGADQTTISSGGVHNAPVVAIDGGVTATIRGVTISDGHNSGIINGGTLTLTDSTVSANDNVANGGGINNLTSGTLTLKSSTVSGNGVLDNGGGIFNSGTLTLTESTVSGNVAAGTIGGGIFNAGTMTLKNSTVSDNTAVSDGGGIFNYSTGMLTLKSSTVSDNTAADGGGIYNQGGTLTLRDSTVSNNTPNDCVGC